jgi:glycosyltransferase involved in cell wall biosynthesis
VLLQSLEGGGAQRRMVTLVNRFVALGREVDLIVVEQRGRLARSVSGQIRIIELDGASLKPAVPGVPWCRDRHRAKLLAQYLRERKPNVLLSGAAAVHALAARGQRAMPRIPLILRASSHPRRPIGWSSPHKYVFELVRRRRRVSQYAQASAVIAVATDVATAVRRLAPSAHIDVIHNPVITKAFLDGAHAAIRVPWTVENNVPIILGIGRLAFAKDFPTLLRAFALVRARIPAHLAILGEGTPRETRALARLARRLGIARDVALLGHTDEVAAWLRHASLFVSSSIWEGSPGAIVEALAMGCPIVATDCPGGSRELLQNGGLGKLIPSRNPEIMAAAIIAQLAEPVDRDALITSIASYTEPGRAEEYLAAIDACVRRVCCARAP